MSLRVVSFGGGVQSMAGVALAVEGVIDYSTFLFANVGEDSEHPATLRYLRKVAMPFASAHGVTLHELHRVRRDGSRETLYGRLVRPGSRSLPIPVRMPRTGAPGRRACTADFKIAPIGRWLRGHGASRDNPATVAIGFSTDEMHRCSRKKAAPWEIPEYPLIDLGMNRAACQTVIARAGLPVPPKSACWFCPFRRPSTWAETRRDTPELFWKAVDLERTLNRRRDDLGRDHVYLTRFGRPLDEAIAEAQPTLFDTSAADGPDLRRRALLDMTTQERTRSATRRPDEGASIPERSQHPYADQFVNEWAWRFEDALRALAAASHDPKDFVARIEDVRQRLAAHKLSMAEGWQVFVARRFADDIGEADRLDHGAQVAWQAGAAIGSETGRAPAPSGVEVAR